MPAKAFLEKIDKKTLQLNVFGTDDFGSDKWVLGAQFLMNYYSIYDYKNKRMGLIESNREVVTKPMVVQKKVNNSTANISKNATMVVAKNATNASNAKNLTMAVVKNFTNSTIK